MAEQRDVLAALERQGTVAGQADAERDYQTPAAHRPERVASFDVLYDDAWAAAWEATSEALQPPGEQSGEQSAEPYGDDFNEAEEVFVHAFIDAYRARWNELTRDAT